MNWHEALSPANRGQPLDREHGNRLYELLPQQIGEGLHLVRRQVRDGAIGHAVPCPKEDVVSLERLASGFFGVFTLGCPDEQINGMLSPLINQGGHRMTFQVIEPA